MISKSEKPVWPGTMSPWPDDLKCNAPEYSVPDDELEKCVAHVLVWNALVLPMPLESLPTEAGLR